jgi:aryl-alcohol dehydrogenase-like predicted oxidoreductase
MQPIYLHEAGFRVLEGLRGKAAELGTPVSLLALAWAMTHPGITAVLIGARSPEQVDQALAGDALDMSAELRAELSAL